MRTGARREGSTLFLALTMVLLVSILGVGLLRLAEENHVETARRLSREQAFWAAEAGLAEAGAIAWQRKEFKDGTPALPTPTNWSGETDFAEYTVTVSNGAFNQPAYRVVSHAVSKGGHTSVLSMMLAQTNALSMGLFGDEELGIQSSGHIVIETYPLVPDQARIGSNLKIQKEDPLSTVDIEGYVVRGANLFETETATNALINTPSQAVGHIDPDPLGILVADSALNLQMQAAEAGPSPTITNSAGETVAVVDGYVDIVSNATWLAGTSYVTQVSVAPGVQLEMEAGVTLFLEGSFAMGGSSALRLQGGSPRDFALYCAGDDAVALRSPDGFVGLVYAPEADVTIDIEGGNDFRGVAWAHRLNLHLQGGGNILLDRAWQSYDTFRDHAYRLETLDWKEGGPPG